MKKNIILGVVAVASLAAVWHVWSKKQNLADGENLDVLSWVEGGVAVAGLSYVMYKAIKKV